MKFAITIAILLMSIQVKSLPLNDTLWIEDGDEIFSCELNTINYSGTSEFIKKTVNSLNILLPSSIFSELYIMLVISENNYSISSEVPVDNTGNAISALTFNGNKKGGGEIKAGVSVDPAYLCHEFFHAFQYEKRGPQPNCICYELDAVIYQQIVFFQLGRINYSISDHSLSNRYITEAMYNLIFDKFNLSDYKQGIVFFKSSDYNTLGYYNNLPLCLDHNYSNSLIVSFLPFKDK